MTPHDEPDSQPDHRFSRDVPGAAIEYRQPDDEDGVFEVRMPIATTGEVRNEGDDPLSRDELSGMARQIDQRDVGVFLDHGRSPIGGRERYSATEKVGEWQDAEVAEREGREAEGDGERQDGTEELVATARLMDPETLPSAAGTLRESLASIKEQVKRDMSLSSSIGWRDDESFPGGVDLMEASIVGIGADPRTTSDAETAVVARAAVEAGADLDELVASVREAVQDTDDHEMSDEDTESDTEADAEQEAPDDEPDETQDEAAEFRERMLELQEAQMETLEAISEAVREDDDEDEENETDEDEDEEDDENAAGEPDDEQESDGSEESDEERVAELERQLEEQRETLDDIRAGGIDADDVDTPDPDDEQDAEEPDGEQDADDDKHELTSKYQIK